MDMRTVGKTYAATKFNFTHFVIGVIIGLVIFALWLNFYGGIQVIKGIFPMGIR
jgi:hypothetical protein